MAMNGDVTTTELPVTTDARNPGVIIVSLLLILVGIIGITGNSLVIIVLLKIIKRHKRNQTYWLIGNQSAADMFSSVQMILIQIESLVENWQTPTESLGGKVYCFLWTTKIFMFGSFVVSSFNLTILSLERYFAVVHPQIYITKLRQSFCYIGVTAWLYAPVMQYMTVGLHFKYNDGICVYERGSPILGVMLFFWEYFIPVSIMTFCFFQVSRKFGELNHIQVTWRSEQSGSTPREVVAFPASEKTPSSSHADNVVEITTEEEKPATSAEGQHEPFDAQCATVVRSGNNDDDHADVVCTTQGQTNVKSRTDKLTKCPQTPISLQRRNTTLTLFTVYIAYILCWTLNQFSFLVYNLGGPLNFDGVYYRFALIMATSNSCINVFIYAFRFKMFQQGIISLFRRT
ncbi:annetocin receptor-like [Apostichopus japonicus]|uniref:annetocin receptor-like n=1 Tax=Stichopus japonicus TaxID=307972 RepID=UPI003AB8D7A9